MSKNWKVLPSSSADLKEQFLINRGLKTETEINEFFRPNLDNFGKLLQIPNIKIAQKRIQKAIELGELIVVFGDYDVDGICASAILYKALTELKAKVLPYIPHRDKEGYGLNEQGLEFARDSGAAVVITVDNGIVALEQAKYAKELGLDLIITDHHIPLEKLPEAFTIVHSTAMCGTAVAWCLIKDLVAESLTKDLLQFVAIATVCDSMPLMGLNRALLAEGLKTLNRTKNLGLLSLFSECGVEPGSVGSYEIGHLIGPRINAIGRLEHAIDALRLLCTQDPAKAKRLAKLLCEANLARQQLTVEAIEMARLVVDGNKKIQVLSNDKWVPGIIGLIAARVAEEYGVPAIAISVGEEHSKGSARSIDGVNIVEAIRSHSDILIDVGGHPGAAGFSIKNDQIEVFKQRLEKHFEKLDLSSEVFLEIEAEVETKKLSKSLVYLIDEFGPFGFGNPQPVLATKRMQATDIRTLKEGKHLKFRAEGIDAIAFGLGDLAKIIPNGQLVDVAYHLEINRFNGREILQLKIKDLKLS